MSKKKIIEPKQTDQLEMDMERVRKAIAQALFPLVANRVLDSLRPAILEQINRLALQASLMGPDYIPDFEDAVKQIMEEWEGKEE